MSPDRWQRLQTLYHNVSELTSPERTRYLEKECSGDAGMRQEIEGLLDCEDKLGGFLDNTAVEALVGMYGPDKSDDITEGKWDETLTDNFIGKRIDDRYVVREYIGSGGMGDVYRAKHHLLENPVAIKRLADRFREIEEYRQRFIDEARRAVLLDHENIARILDVVEDSDEVLVIMEFIEGQTLRASLGHAFDLDEFLPIAIQCAAALESAHKKRIVHLDIKPENIMLTEAGKVKVCDFGVARQLPSVDVSASTNQPWTFGGTPAYMAPEVIVGNHFDTRADIFSLGVVFYEMLAGKHPFRAEDVRATTNRIMTASVAPLLRTNRKVPHRLIRLLDAMLAKEPDRRLSSASEVLSELQWIRFRKNFLKDAWQSADEVVRRRPVTAAALALAAVISVIGIVYFNPFSPFSVRNPDAVRYYTEALDPLHEYYKPENVDRSIESFSQALKLDNTYAEAWAGLGEAYSLKYEDSKKQDLLLKAQDACLQSVRFDYKLAAAHVCLGTVAQEKGEYEDAEKEFRKAIEFSPRADDAWRGLALAIESQKKFKEAETAYLMAVDIKPNYWASYTWLGKFYNNRGKYPEAIKQYEMAMAYSHNNGLVLYSLGVPYFRMGKFDEAIELFNKAIKTQPTLEKARNNLGAAYFLTRRFAEAIPLLEEVSRKSPEFVPIGNLARAYWWSGQKERAIPLYKQAIDQAGNHLEVNPQDSDAHLAMSLYYAMISDRYRAQLHLSIALNSDGDMPDAHDLITAAMVYAQFGESGTALEFIEQALHHGLNRFEIVADPEFDGLRSYKGYATIMAQK
jgi:serine/threonine protein kinase/Tfp pilus assembly protein PilF